MGGRCGGVPEEPRGQCDDPDHDGRGHQAAETEESANQYQRDCGGIRPDKRGPFNLILACGRSVLRLREIGQAVGVAIDQDPRRDADPDTGQDQDDHRAQDLLGAQIEDHIGELRHHHGEGEQPDGDQLGASHHQGVAHPRLAEQLRQASRSQDRQDHHHDEHETEFDSPRPKQRTVDPVRAHRHGDAVPGQRVLDQIEERQRQHEELGSLPQVGLSNRQRPTGSGQCQNGEDVEDDEGKVDEQPQPCHRER